MRPSKNCPMSGMFYVEFKKDIIHCKFTVQISYTLLHFETSVITAVSQPVYQEKYECVFIFIVFVVLLVYNQYRQTDRQVGIYINIDLDLEIYASVTCFGGTSGGLEWEGPVWDWSTMSKQSLKATEVQLTSPT